MKLISRYNWFNLPVLCAIFTLSGIFLYKNIHHLLISNFDDSLNEQAEYISRYVVKYKAFPIEGITDEWKISFVKASINEKGRQLQFIEAREQNENKRYRQLSYFIILNKIKYKVTISKSLESLDGLSQSIAETTILSLLFTISITLILNQIVLRRLWMPFYTTLSQLKEFKLGKKQHINFKKTSTDEFNFMEVQLSGLIKNAEDEYILLKEFTENASHELQTPLAIIRSKLDLILQGENLDARQSNALHDAYQAVSRMSNLGQSLLLLSKIENKLYNERVKVDLKQKIENKILQLEEFWAAKNISLTTVLSEASIWINPELLEILLNNVLSNASNHNVKDGKLIINLRKYEFSVSNTGEALEIDQERIFTRFYKQEKSSNNNGLGLSIIKQICDQSELSITYSYLNSLHTFSFNWN